MSKSGVFSGPYFPVFSLNTGKYGRENTPYLDTFHAVRVIYHTSNTNGSFYVDNDKVTVVISVKINVNDKPNKFEYMDNKTNDYRFFDFLLAFSYLHIFCEF